MNKEQLAARTYQAFLELWDKNDSKAYHALFQLLMQQIHDYTRESRSSLEKGQLEIRDLLKGVFRQWIRDFRVPQHKPATFLNTMGRTVFQIILTYQIKGSTLQPGKGEEHSGSYEKKELKDLTVCLDELENHDVRWSFTTIMVLVFQMEHQEIATYLQLPEEKVALIWTGCKVFLKSSLASNQVEPPKK